MKKFLMFLLALSILICACSCGKKETTKTENKTNETTSDTTEVTDTAEVTEESKFFVSDKDVYEIETPYAPLYYPVEYKDIVTTEVTEGDGGYAIKFSAQLEGKSVPLYTVIFGDYEGEYIAAGTLTTDFDKSVRVYFEDHSGALTEAGLTGASETTYLAMCEDMNVVISNLVYTSGMEID